MIREWCDDPVTHLFLKKISATIDECREKDRYVPGVTTPEECGMFNAYTEGQIDGLGAPEIIKEDMKREATNDDS